MKPEETLEKVAKEVSVCVKCDLHLTRKLAVPGEGPANAQIMFIGEGPGFHENEQGRPFVGAAGHFLDELLASIKMKRSDVFITNVVKCRPPGNRDPEPNEIETCTGNYLDRQIQAINPKIIVTLGRFSMAHFLPTAKISAVHGQAKWVKKRLVVAMYHPAAALHQKSLRTTIEQDFLKLPGYVQQAARAPESATDRSGSGSDEDTPENEPPKQLNLF